MKVFENIENDLDKYSNLLSEGSGNSFFRALTNFFNSNEDSRIKEFKEINASIKKLDYQFYFFIDDLDRLNKDEMLETLRLLRLIGIFSNIKFIVAYHKEYIISILEKADTKINYLEKIFPLEIHIAPIPENQFSNLLLSSLPDSIISNDETKKQLYSALTNQFSTIRQVLMIQIEFQNVYKFEKLQKNILLDELLVLLIIKFLYPKVYASLRDEDNELIVYESVGEQEDLSLGKILFGKSYWLNKDCFEKLKDTFDFSESQAKQIEKLLNYLYKDRRDVKGGETVSIVKSKDGRTIHENFDPRSLRHSAAKELYFSYGAEFEYKRIKFDEVSDLLIDTNDDSYLNSKVIYYLKNDLLNDFFNYARDEIRFPIENCYKNLFKVYFKLSIDLLAVSDIRFIVEHFTRTSSILLSRKSSRVSVHL